MNFPVQSPQNRVVVIVSALACMLLIAIFVGISQTFINQANPGAARAEQRHKNLAELRASNAQVLNHYAWQDQEKNVIRLPINRAIELMLTSWNNAGQGRKQLLSRVLLVHGPPPELAPAVEKPAEEELEFE